MEKYYELTTISVQESKEAKVIYDRKLNEISKTIDQQGKESIAYEALREVQSARIEKFLKTKSSQEQRELLNLFYIILGDPDNRGIKSDPFVKMALESDVMKLDPENKSPENSEKKSELLVEFAKEAIIDIINSKQKTEKIKEIILLFKDNDQYFDLAQRVQRSMIAKGGKEPLVTLFLSRTNKDIGTLSKLWYEEVDAISKCISREPGDKNLRSISPKTGGTNKNILDNKKRLPKGRGV